ncbi:hypothetical protein DPMN_115924, partial [Dreissena polymorpha]
SIQLFPHWTFAHLRGTNILVKKLPRPSSHVIQLTGTIFELNSHIKETNVLTKFHENWAKNVTSRIHIEKNAPPTGGHVFSPIWTIFELVRDIKKTNVLTNFHDDWAKIVTSRVLTRKTAPPPDSDETNVLTKFYENLAKNVTASRAFTCFHYLHIEKNAPPTGGHVFSPIWTIFELPNKENSPPPGSHVCQLTGTIFELNSHIKETNVLTKFHENWAKNVTSRVEKCPATGGHVFSPIWTIFELVLDINNTNVLTNFHDDWAKIVTSRVFTSHVIQLTGTIFKLNSHIKETNVLTKFHENWAKNVTSSVFICFHYIHIEKNAPPTGGHVFSPTWTIFELVRDINKTNVLNNFHDDWAKIVTSRVFTRKTAPPTGGHANILTNFDLDRDIIGTNLLTNVYKPNVDDGRTENGQRSVTKAHLSNQLSSDNHLVDGRTDRPTDRPT